MRDVRDAKTRAQTLREELKARSISVTHSESLELVLGFHNWNVLAARIQSERQPFVSEQARSPTKIHACGGARNDRRHAHLGRRPKASC
jgi:uncharacterized protein